MWALSRLRVRCFYILTTKSGDEGNTYRAVFLGKERFYSFRIQLSKSFSKNYLPYQSSISFRLRSSPFCFPSAKREKRDKRIGMRQKIERAKPLARKKSIYLTPLAVNEQLITAYLWCPSEHRMLI